jgi:hypothetical protein
MQVSAAGEARDLRTFKPGTADLGFAPPAVALVPHMNENRVASYDLSDVLK